MNFVGEKFDKSNPNRFSRTWIARQIRLDLKDAFGKAWKFGVRKAPGSSNSIDITIKKAPADATIVAVRNGYSRTALTDEYEAKIYRIANAYNYDNSDGQTDYFDRNYYVYLDYQIKE